MRYIFILLLCLLNFGLIAQNFKGDRVRLRTDIVEEGNYYHYEPPFKATPNFETFDEVKLDFPEQVFMSILSAKTQEWVAYNELDPEKALKKEKSFLENQKKMSREKNFYELHQKLTFSFGGQEYAAITFLLNLEQFDSPKPGAYMLVKDNDKWKFYRGAPFRNLIMSLMAFKKERFKQLILKDFTNDNLVRELVELVHNDGFIDFNKLFTEYQSWYKKDQFKVNYFLN